MPDNIVCESRAKTGVCALYKVENGAQKPAFALGAQYTIITIFVRGHYSPLYRNGRMRNSIFTLCSSLS